MNETRAQCSGEHEFPSSSGDTSGCYCGDEYLQTSSYCMHQSWIIGLAVGGALLLLITIIILSAVVAWLATRGKKKDEEEDVQDQEKTNKEEDVSIGSGPNDSIQDGVSAAGDAGNVTDNRSEAVDGAVLEGGTDDDMLGRDHYEALPGEQETVAMPTATTSDPAHPQPTQDPMIPNGHITYEMTEQDEDGELYDGVGPSPDSNHGDSTRKNRDSGLSLSEDPHVREILKSEAGRNFFPSLHNVSTDVDYTIQRPTVTMDVEKEAEDTSKILRQKRTQENQPWTYLKGLPEGQRESGTYSRDLYSNMEADTQLSAL